MRRATSCGSCASTMIVGSSSPAPSRAASSGRADISPCLPVRSFDTVRSRLGAGQDLRRTSCPAPLWTTGWWSIGILRRVRLTKLTVQLGKRFAVIEAKLGGEEVRLFKVLAGGRREVSAATGAVSLGGLRLKLTGAGFRALTGRLGLDALPAQRFASLSSNLTGLAKGGSAPGGGGEHARGPGPEPCLPGTERRRPSARRSAAGCTQTARRARRERRHDRLAGARVLSSATSPPARAPAPPGGASADPPDPAASGATEALSYGFHFPFAGSSWFDPGPDPASAADDSAAIRFGGAVRFLYSGHGIDLLTSAPEIEIAGAKTRAIFAISESGGLAQRQVLVNLDLSRAAAVRASGNAYTYERVPGAIRRHRLLHLRRLLPPGHQFGCISVTFTTS